MSNPRPRTWLLLALKAALPLGLACAAAPPEGSTPSATSSSATSSPSTRVDDRPEATTFRAVLDRKLESEADYTEAERQQRTDLFLANARRFFARYYVPPGGLGLPESLGSAAEAFLGEVVALASASATARGDSRIRLRDVDEALQEVTPHRVDDFGDVAFSLPSGNDGSDGNDPNPSGGGLVLSVFDIEAFRDFGLEWRLLQVMVEMDRIALPLEPDPPATERLAEGLARYSVLLLRLAGKLAADEKYNPFVGGEHLARAAEEIRRPTVMDQAGAADAPGTEDTAGSEGALMTNATDEVGIDFRHRSSAWLERFRRSIPVVPPTFSGGGVAAGDIDGDGRSDLLFVGGFGNVLYLDAGDGTYTRSPESERLSSARDGLPGEARQPIIADFDNDGDQDVLITYVGAAHRLLRNAGGGRLEDATAEAGLGDNGAVVGAATVFDFDRDGLLDVYVCNFGDYLDAGTRATSTLTRSGDNGIANRLFRNRGGLRFEEVAESGAADRGWCRGVSHTDFDRDGHQDLVIANDAGRNRLLRNTGKGRFEDVSEELGMTRSDHSRSVGLGDLEADGFPDIYISNINMLTKDPRYVPTGRKADRKKRWHVIETSRLYLSVSGNRGLRGYQISEKIESGNAAGWAWDAEFFDFDNDGDDDLYVTNGSNEYFNFLAREVDGSATFDWNREPNVLYRNEGERLGIVPAQNGADLASNSRAAVYVDPDRDGDLDIAINGFHSPAVFLRNELPKNAGHWLKIRLEGDPERGSSRDAIGAVILATTADGNQIWRQVRGGSGHLSMEPKEQHLGLGSASRVDLVIKWPGGGIQQLEGLEADRTWSVRENSPPRAVEE